MKQSEVYGYNYPLNWDEDELLDKVKEALVRQVGYELSLFEPYENDVEKLAEADWISMSEAQGLISKWIEKWIDEHIQII